MTTSEIIIIVALAVAAAMLITAYITLVIAWRYARRIERKYLGEPEEYMGKEYESGQQNRHGTDPASTSENEEKSFLRYKCRREKDSWLLSLSPPVSDRKTDKDTEVP